MKETKKTKSMTGTVKAIENEVDYRKAKAKLEQLQRNSSWKTLFLFFSFFALCTAALFFSVFYEQHGLGLKSVLLALLAGGLVAALMVVYMRLISEIEESSIRSKINTYEAENIKNDVVEDIFENSIRMSYKYLDQYYLQTKEQAQHGFLATMFVAGFGALLIAG